MALSGVNTWLLAKLLVEAAKSGDISTLNALLAYPEVYAQAAAMNNEALLTALENGHFEIVYRLLEIDAVREQVTANSNDALQIACENGDLDILNQLLQIHGVIEQATAYNCALRWACENGHLNIVNRLLEIDTVRKQVIAGDDGALLAAAQYGHLDIINRLLEIDAVREQVTANDIYALRLAWKWDNHDVVARLLDIDDVRNHPSLPSGIQKQLPLIMVIKANQVEAVRAHASSCGLLSFYSALATGNPYIIERLLYPANVKRLKSLIDGFFAYAGGKQLFRKLFNRSLTLVENAFNRALRYDGTTAALSLLDGESGKQQALAFDLYGLRSAAMKENHVVIKSILAMDEVYAHPEGLIKLLEESHDKLSLDELQMIAKRFAPQIQALGEHIGETIAYFKKRNNKSSSKALEDDAKVSDTKAELIASRGAELDFAKALAAQFHDRLTDETLLLQLWTTLQIAFEDRAISACTSSSSGPSYSSSSSSSRACSSSSVYCVSDDATEARAPVFLPSFAATQAASSQEEASSQRLERENQQDETMTEKKQRKH